MTRTKGKRTTITFDWLFSRNYFKISSCWIWVHFSKRYTVSPPFLVGFFFCFIPFFLPSHISFSSERIFSLLEKKRRIGENFTIDFLCKDFQVSSVNGLEKKSKTQKSVLAVTTHSLISFKDGKKLTVCRNNVKKTIKIPQET